MRPMLRILAPNRNWPCHLRGASPFLPCMDARLDPAKYAGLSGLLEKSLVTATIDDKGWHDHGHGSGSVHGHYVKLLTFKDLAASVVEDVSVRIRWCPATTMM
jgi:hypothetical protein